MFGHLVFNKRYIQAQTFVDEYLPLAAARLYRVILCLFFIFYSVTNGLQLTPRCKRGGLEYLHGK